MLYGLVVGILTLIGTTLLGITINRAKIFPRLIGIILIVGVSSILPLFWAST